MQDKNILIVDASLLRLEFLTLALKDICQVRAAPDYAQMLECLKYLRPDLILLLEPRGHMDNLAVLERLQADPDFSFVPVLFCLTGEDNRLEAAALSRGAADCITWPLAPHPLRLKVRHLLRQKEQLSLLAADLRRAEAAADNVREAMLDIYLRLLAAADPLLADHARRVGRLAECLALAVNHRLPRVIPESDIPLIAAAACLHDLGKLALPPGWRHKNKDMGDEEKKLYRDHPLLGAKILQDAADKLGDNHFLQLAAEILSSHHERYDGSGYPQGKCKQEISFAAQVAAVANRFDHGRMPPLLGYGRDDNQALAQALGGENEGSLFAPIIDHTARECEREFSLIRV